MKRTLKYAIPVILSTLILILFCSCADSGVEKGEIMARISGDSVTVSAAFTEQVQNAHAGKTVYLFELEPGESAESLAEIKPVGEATMAEHISFSLPLSDGGASRLTYAFLLATYDGMANAYVPLNKAPLYVSNPDQLADDPSAAPEYSSIKGVCTDSLTAVIELGASHATVDLPIEEYLVAAGGAGAYRHEFLGESFYFDGARLDLLEKKLEGLENADCAAYLRVYLGTSYEKLDENEKFLSYPETKEGREYYQINFGDKRAVASYAAFVDLLASRYPSVRNLIVGKAQNSPDGGGEAYVNEYAAALQITHNILCSYRAGSQVYAATDKYVTSASATGKMSAETFLSALAERIKGQGDFNWGVAAECEPAITSSDSVWYDNESNATLSPTNLSYFTDELLGADKLLYGGWVRPLIISDFSIASAESSPISESRQAASYAYTYYAAVKTGKIDAIIYSELCDGEGNTRGIVSASGKKEIYSMIKRVDTDADIGDEVGELIGGEWTSLYTNDEIRDRVVRGKYSTGTAEIKGTEGYELSPVVLFDRGTLSGFEVADGGYAALVRKNGTSQLTAHFSGGELCSVAAHGISSGLFDGDLLAIPVKLTPRGDAAVGNYSITLTLIQNDKNGEVRTYTSRVSVAPSTDSTAVFDISRFSQSKTGDDVTVVLSVDPSDAAPFDLTVEKIVLAKENSNTVLIVVLVIAGVLVLGGLVTVFVFWFRKNYTFDFGSKNKKKNKKK